MGSASNKITGYEACYQAGREDFYGGDRLRAPLCADRRAYDDGYHDARRKQAEERYFDNLRYENERQRSSEIGIARQFANRNKGIPSFESIRRGGSDG